MVLEREYPEDERISKEIRTLQDNGHNLSLACFTKENRKSKEVVNNLTIFRKPISLIFMPVVMLLGLISLRIQPRIKPGMPL